MNKWISAWIVCVLLGSVMSAGVMAGSVSTSSVQGSITRSGTAVKGTPAYEAIRNFLVQSTTAGQHTQLANRSSAPATFSVSLTSRFSTQADARSAAIVGGSPPVPLPGGTHQAGDTFSVSSCGGGSSETWNYEWVATSSGGGWVLQSYSFARTQSCSQGGA